MTETASTNPERQRWIGILSRAPKGELESRFKELSVRPEVTPLRSPETGLVMVRGRTGGVGNRFNLGEMTVTRSAVRLPTGETGISYVGGRDRDHAHMAAVVDAMMQSSQWRSVASTSIVEPLAKLDAERKAQVLRQRAATRVDFFTMTRTREDKK